MRNKIRQDARGRLLLGALLILVLSACGSQKAEPTPTFSVDAIFTAAFQTFSAQQATQLALTPPTNTPSPTPLPTLPPPSPLPLPTIPLASPSVGGGATTCDNSAYVADVTIPDGTTVDPGKKFEKKWKLQNTGSCTWSTSYKLAFDSGDLMGGATTFIAVPVPPGNQAEVAVNLTAPTAAGNYKGTWRMQNDKSQPFGNFITVVIKVGQGSSNTPTTPVPTSASGEVTISGNAGLSDVLITYAGTGGAESGTVTAAGGGDYSFSVASGWSGTVTPSKGTWVFSPASKNYTNITSDQSGQNYSVEEAATATAKP